MTPATHAFISWGVANVFPISRRDRLLVFAAGMVPDLDGFTLLVSHELYVTWHHVICHNLLAAGVVTGFTLLFANQKKLAAGLAFIAFHFHLVCDYFGAGGRDGSIWVLPYLYPLVGGWDGPSFVGPRWYWNPWQWELTAWPNILITAVTMAWWVYIAVRLDRTWFEFVWPRMDRELCATLRKWFGGQKSEGWTDAELAFQRKLLVLSCVVCLFSSLIAALHATGSL